MKTFISPQYVSSGQRYRRCCTCTPCRICTRAGTAESSVVFTGLRQYAHPTYTLFLEPAWVSHL